MRGGLAAAALLSGRRGESLVRRLLAAGASPDEGGEDGVTATMEASKWGTAAVLSMLLDAGGDCSRRDETGRAAVHHAAGSPDESGRKVRILLDRGSPVDAADNTGRTPLFIAAESDSEDAAAILLTEGAAPGSEDGSGRTPLLVAAVSDSGGVVEALLAGGAVFRDGDWRGADLLWRAAAAGAGERTLAALAGALRGPRRAAALTRALRAATNPSGYRTLKSLSERDALLSMICRGRAETEEGRAGRGRL